MGLIQKCLAFSMVLCYTPRRQLCLSPRNYIDRMLPLSISAMMELCWYVNA